MIIMDEMLLAQAEETIFNVINGLLDFNNHLIMDDFFLYDGDLDGDDVNARGDPPTRINNYYEEVIPEYDDEQFYLHFRMSREAFIDLQEIISLHVRNLNDPIPLGKKILMTIWLLATPDSFRSVADRFNFSESTAHFSFKEIILILSHNLLPNFISWPNDEESALIENAFLNKTGGFSGIVGAIDGCHISIRQPPGNANDYYNRKGSHSIILQGTCDHNRKFIDVLIGRPGRAHDSPVFRSSPLYGKITDA
ncbi:GSCOCG00012596001-RA-CDS [Cotesia congregata]|nr:GSCOCG00012596001-RA-CDS [Cotesia congregata]